MLGSFRPGRNRTPARYKVDKAAVIKRSHLVEPHARPPLRASIVSRLMRAETAACATKAEPWKVPG